MTPGTGLNKTKGIFNDTVVLSNLDDLEQNIKDPIRVVYQPPSLIFAEGNSQDSALQHCRDTPSSANLKDVLTTSLNPQSNAICARMHQTVGNILRKLLHTTPPTDVENAK